MIMDIYKYVSEKMSKNSVNDLINFFEKKQNAPKKETTIPIIIPKTKTTYNSLLIEIDTLIDNLQVKVK